MCVCVYIQSVILNQNFRIEISQMIKAQLTYFDSFGGKLYATVDQRVVLKLLE